MIKLFNEYKNSGKLSEALLIGRNMFNRNPDNLEIFDAYFSYLCTLAESLPLLSDRMQFLDQANVAVVFFSENTVLDETIINHISECRSRLDGICRELQNTQHSKEKSAKQKIEQHNTELLKKIYALKDKIQSAMSQEEFDAVLAQIGDVDNEIEKEALTETQSSNYNTLTKDLAELISEKMRKLEYKKNVEYNKQAADSFAKAFREFRADESKYKKQTQLFALVSTTLFAFDAARLFNETLIYYNHVYSYIFGKLDDDGKLALTRYSIECEREMR